MFVKVRVKVAVGGGLALRMHSWSMYSTIPVTAMARVWNWMADNCERAADNAIAVPQPACAKSPSRTVTACQDVVDAKS